MTALEILTKAKNEGWALGAFNAGNLEIAKAIVDAAKNLQSPVIMETSTGEADHFGMKNFLGIVKNFREDSGVTILTNFDHGPGLEECQTAIEAGYDLVHFDGSELPYEENVKITKALVEQAHAKGILIEAELDKITGESKPYEEMAESIQAMNNYTDPQKAADFVAQTGCDLLAVLVGNIHGVYRTPKKLDLERLNLIRQAVGGKTLPAGRQVFFSLHGGSTVGGEDIQAAIRLGVVKININTELRVAFRTTLENILKGSDEVAVYKIMTPVMAAVQKMVEEKLALFHHV
jgi:fructose-bisphosphate aldolase class II